MIRRLDHLIYLVRERTKNLDYAADANGVATEGILDNRIIEFFNAAQDHLQAVIINVYPNEFVVSKEISLVANQEEYTISDNVFVNNKLISVEYNSNNNSTDFEPLDQRTIRDRDSRKGYPNFYIRRGNKLLVNPVPSSSQGRIRVSYYRELDDLDIRRAKISAVSGLTSTTFTNIDLTDTDPLPDETSKPINLTNVDHICVIDRDGTVKAYNIPVNTYTAASDLLTPRSTHVFGTGETLAVGDWVVFGQYATTHSKLPNNCERYLLTYVQKRLMTTDESNTSIEEDEELKQIETDIVNSFAEDSRDVKYIPVLDHEALL